MESQLLVERKLARQHVDTKMAEQQYMRQQDEENRAPIRPVTKTIGSTRIFGEIKEQASIARPLTENNYKLQLVPSLEGFTKHNELMEKENDPEMAEQLQQIPKRTGRASICPGAQRIPAAQLPRRNSLIPLPSLPVTAKLLPCSFMPLAPIQAENVEDADKVESNCQLEPTAWDSPKVNGATGSKKLNSLLRKSIQRRMQMKSPMQQQMRRVGVNVGMEKVRVSIGSRGRMAHRVLSNARRVTKETQQQQQFKQSKREKERGWNIGTAAPRTVL